MFIIRYSIAICLLVIFFLLITVEYVYTAARHVTRIEVWEVEFRIIIGRLFGIGETLQHFHWH